jgi:glycosyltransferase involved in cell wall biosynthesis
MEYLSSIIELLIPVRYIHDPGESAMRVALVHDYLIQFGGAERVLTALMKLFPNAPVFTMVYDKERMGVAFDERRLRTSFLQRFPGTRRYHRYFPLFMPLAIEQFDLSEFDVVLSATHSFGKGVVVGPNTLHISYCFTPTRYIWDDSHRYVREFSPSPFFQRFAPLALSYIRLWDYYASQRVDTYITLSDYVARRIWKYYNRKAEVIPPPVAVDNFKVSETNEGYYVVVARLVPYKRVDIAIDACEQLGRKLKIVGSGPELAMLKAKAGPNTEFIGFVSDEKLQQLYSGARALLFPQEEDFGITPLEAAASGKPTIAFDAGGAKETIIPGVTGLLYPQQTVSSLIAAITESEKRVWDAHAIRLHAEKYNGEIFAANMAAVVAREWQHFQGSRELV